MSEQQYAEKLELKSDKFSCLLDDGKHYATLSFEKKKYHQRDHHEISEVTPTHIYEFYHIEVPQAYRGKGIAMPFAKACFDYALQHNWKVKVTCTYLREKFLGLHSGHYKSILVE
ncbi:predicted protein [Naegleria gruberi]|uniref:Predicted protein n=1 Tax=Naegleria gruberi TaxID=5762 RepID=D2V880_NAEGR|nr:uncharacterized protein NAEGRDRAFT_65060 [Naegleria gruberi]EFC47132.1 predicted protein [Naegleria gruberi]|eukprot:XP_002679876.1 predicted protein [Naegleria gruberi strain NEG-M]